MGGCICSGMDMSLLTFGSWGTKGKFWLYVRIGGFNALLGVCLRKGSWVISSRRDLSILYNSGTFIFCMILLPSLQYLKP